MVFPKVEYFDEVGTGLGPTLEFYSLVSKEFARRDLKIWRDVDTTYPGVYVHHPHGLFPAPIAKSEGGKNNEKRIYVFRTIGQFVAKAMLDSRIIDMSFNKIFLKLILGEEVPLTIASLKVHFLHTHSVCMTNRQFLTSTSIQALPTRSRKCKHVFPRTTKTLMYVDASLRILMERGLNIHHHSPRASTLIN